MVMLVVSPLFSFTVSANAIEADVTISGKAGILLEQELTSEELKALENVTLTDGWELKGDILTKFYPASANNIITDKEDSHIEVDEEGNYEVSIFSDLSGDESISIGYDRSYLKTVKTEIDINCEKLSDLDLIYKVNFNEFMDVMDGDYSSTLNENIEVIQSQESLDKKSLSFDVVLSEDGASTFNLPTQGPDTGGDVQIDEDGEVGRTGAYVHCNRFNGPHGNQVYYANKLKGALNFILSDCDYAFTRYNCAEDYTSKTNCKGLLYYGSSLNSNVRNCSTILGHNVKYHAH